MVKCILPTQFFKIHLRRYVFLNESSDGLALEECNCIDFRGHSETSAAAGIATCHLSKAANKGKMRRKALGPAANIYYETNGLH